MIESIFKSTRSLLAFLAMILLFVVVIGHFLGYNLPGDVLSLVSMVLSSIIVAYYGTRTPTLPTDSTTTTTSTTTIPANPTSESVKAPKPGDDS